MPHRKVPSNSTIPLFTQQAVTERVGIKYDTLQSWIRAGKVTPSYTVGSRPLFTESDVGAIERVKREREQARQALRLDVRQSSG